MNDANHIEQDDLHLFALQLLPDAAMREFAEHLRDCPECRAQLAEIQGGLVAYAMTAQMKVPPAEARERLLRQVALEKKIVPIDRAVKHLDADEPAAIAPSEESHHAAAATLGNEKPVDLKPVPVVEMKSIEPVDAKSEPLAESKPAETVATKSAAPVEVISEAKPLAPAEVKQITPVEVQPIAPVETAPAASVQAPVVAAPFVIAAASSEHSSKQQEPAVKHQEPVLYPRNSRMFQMDSPEERRRSRIAPILAWTGWAVAAMAAVAAGVQYQQQKLLQDNLSAETAQLNQNVAQAAQAKRVLQTLTDANAMQVSLHVPLTKGAPPKLDPEAHATFIPGAGSLVFVASHLDPLLPAKTYELWVLPTDPTQAPIPAGLFKPDLRGNATLVMPDLPKNISAKGFGVTVENDGGSKTPTAPIVLAGM